MTILKEIYITISYSKTEEKQELDKYLDSSFNYSITKLPSVEIDKNKYESTYVIHPVFIFTDKEKELLLDSLLEIFTNYKNLYPRFDN